MPSTKPYISFDAEGVCNGCRAAERRAQGFGQIDWTARSRAFDALIEEARAQKAPLYDVAVPVSGGKDSITQVSRLLGRGLRILAISIDYGIKTEIGKYNLNLIPAMGASLIVFTPERELHPKLVRIGFEDFGDPDLMSHCLLMAMPLRISYSLSVPLVLMGENTADVFGGDASIAQSDRIDRVWFSKYAANSGHEPHLIAERYGIDYERMRVYDFPDEITGSSTRCVFASTYFPWDGEEHLKIAMQYGFRPLDRPTEGTYRNYVGIDEKIHRLHQYLKVLKFGYGRATDHACEDIRNGRLTREDAKALVREHDLRPLSAATADAFCAFTGMERCELDRKIETFRNCDIWRQNNAGDWFIPGHLEG